MIGLSNARIDGKKNFFGGPIEKNRQEFLLFTITNWSENISPKN
jgi:hypothetical protein